MAMLTVFLVQDAGVDLESIGVSDGAGRRIRLGIAG
jgi:hypothetical protein